MQSDFAFERFNLFIRQEDSARRDTYLNAPLYYALTGRHGIWVYEGYNALMVVCRHPHVEDRLLAFPEIGAADGKLMASVLADLTPPAGGVQLARFSAEDLAQLREALSQKNYNPVSQIEICEEKIMDWRYPAHILDTRKVSLLKGRDFMKIRNKIRKVEGQTEILPLHHPDAIRAIRAAHKYWEGSLMMRDIEAADSSGFYKGLFAMVDEWPELFHGLVFVQGKRPVGFTVYDTPFMQTSNLLANLSDAAIAGLADFQIVETCRAMQAQDISFLNFGGSETETLDLFKQKFMPVQSLDLLSAEVIYAPQRDMQVKSGPLKTSTDLL